ncbi:hypothetical protein CCACVL1_00561 [Corchorus capsularis]|uniref:Uncharacterized protein n=1 Tax=Corchorus capsularis TaxID=210143 RepID=A0A1R3KW92_COCAP|nr:hypothetical protein CCACVL1_00561 [Corchorus capsularis]
MANKRKSNDITQNKQKGSQLSSQLSGGPGGGRPGRLGRLLFP